jgi:hypothetical protein
VYAIANFPSSSTKVIRGVLYSPELLRVPLRVGSERRFAVDDPSIDAVRRPRRTEM